MPPWRRHSQYSKYPEPAVGYPDACAGLAQLAEHLSCKEKVIGSNPIPGSFLAVVCAYDHTICGSKHKRWRRIGG